MDSTAQRTSAAHSSMARHIVWMASWPHRTACLWGTIAIEPVSAGAWSMRSSVRVESSKASDDSGAVRWTRAATKPQRSEFVSQARNVLGCLFHPANEQSGGAA